jgi:PAS domain-containing protein
MLSPILNLERVRNAKELISAYDEQLNITLWNPAVAKRMGIPEKDAIGKSLLQLYPHLAGDQRIKFLNIALQLDQSFYFPNMIYLYTQPFTFYTQYIQPQKTNGKVTGVINIVRDHLMEETFLPEEFLVYFDREPKNSSSSLQHDKDRSHL